MIIEILFWLSIFVVAYIYFGFFLLIWIIAKLRGSKNATPTTTDNVPEVTVFIAAYNEKDFIEQKMLNSRQLRYPKDKLHFLWVTDGSNDGTPTLLSQYPENTVLHEDARRGKIGAMNRGMQHVNTPIVIFCDANTYLNADCIIEMVRCFDDPRVGCVAGEKRIFDHSKDAASGAGEGFYWKYESKIKQLESDIDSTVGAAGELFAIRTALFEPVFADAILDDFVISMRIAKQGFKVRYCPKAYATETSSANVTEELKRKVRIAAGGIQTAVRLKGLLCFWKHPWLSFSYISHKLLRWTLLPFCFILALLFNAILCCQGASAFYTLMLALQILFYVMGVIGWILQNNAIKVKILFIPYYLLMMNYAIMAGILRFARGKHSVNWARAQRMKK